MKYRKGVFIVVYTKKENEFLFLVLKRKLHWTGWEIPKGGIEKNEKIIDAVKRELKEETGIKKHTKIKKIDFSGKYEYNKEFTDRKGFKGQTFEAVYLIEVKPNHMDKIEIDKKEHSSFKWLSFKKTINKLTWQNQKDALKKVYEYLISEKYKGFRKNLTSEGNILLAGKNQENNEKLVKEHVKPEDLVFHTRSRGSPFVVIKSEDNKISNQDINEAASFCAQYSKEWKNTKKGNQIKVHYFKGKQIEKKPKMAIGSFYVKQSKEMNVKKILNNFFSKHK